jgi:hypothetical protein
MGFFGSDELDASARFDRVRVHDPDGSSRELTGAQFDALPFDQRIRILLSGKPRFWLKGKELSMRDAINKS